MTEKAKAQNKRNSNRFWIILAIVVVVLLLLFSCVATIIGIALLASGRDIPGIGGDAVAVIRLEGVISSAYDSGGLLADYGSVDPESFTEDLEEAVEDDDVRAIVLRVNSPGGSPAASQEIYEEVVKAAKKKPIVASVADVAASGAYYVISPVQEIWAPKAADIGSIGVFIEVLNLQELYKKLGIKVTIIKEGKFKTMGDPSKPLTKEERAILQNYAKVIYDQFIDDVAKARKKLDLAEVKKLATGRTWPASQAKGLDLIDNIGNYQDAIDRAAKLGKIKGEPEIITYKDYDWLDAIDTGLKSLKNIGKVPVPTKSLR